MNDASSGGRIGDAERERAIHILAHHAGTGLLSLTEFSDRSALVAMATTKTELAHLLVDLPIPLAEPVDVPRNPLRRIVVTSAVITVIVLAITVTTGHWLWLLAIAAIPAVLYVARRRLPSIGGPL